MIRTLLHSAPIVMLSHQRPFSCYFTAPTTVPHRDSIQSGQRPERHDRIESGEHRVTPIMRKRIGIEHHARINNDRHGIVTYNAGEAVRLLTFGVRANGIFVFVMPC